MLLDNVYILARLVYISVFCNLQKMGNVLETFLSYSVFFFFSSPFFCLKVLVLVSICNICCIL